MTRPLVVIGFADALAAPEAAWSLRDAGYDVVAFAHAGSRPPARRVRGLALEPVTAPQDDADAAVRDVERLLARLRPAAVLPLDDAALWTLARTALPAGSVLAGPVGAQAELALDKRLQLAAARDAGFDVPPTHVLDEPAELPAEAPLPCVIRPALAVAARDGRLRDAKAHVCRDAAQARAALAALAGAGPLLLQPLVRGIGGGVFGLARADGVAAWSAHRRVRMMNPEGGGSSACAAVAPSAAERDACARLLGAAAWRGPFMVELLRDGERTWFVELNGRLWGSLALARRRGLEYPAWTVDDTLGRPGPCAQPPAGLDGVVCRNAGRELAHLLFVLGGRAAPGDAPGRLRTLRAVLRVGRDERWYNWRRGEPGVFLDDTVQTAAGVVRRALARR